MGAKGLHTIEFDKLAGVAWDALLTEAKVDPDTMYNIFYKKILELQGHFNGPSKHKAYRLIPNEKKHRSWQQ